LPEDASREHLERRVVEDLVLRDNRFKTKVDVISEAVIGAKRLALEGEEASQITEYLLQVLSQPPPNVDHSNELLN
jgi:predicted SpoU family rRNA methylase